MRVQVPQQLLSFAHLKRRQATNKYRDQWAVHYAAQSVFYTTILIIEFVTSIVLAFVFLFDCHPDDIVASFTPHTTQLVPFVGCIITLIWCVYNHWGCDSLKRAPKNLYLTCWPLAWITGPIAILDRERWVEKKQMAEDEGVAIRFLRKPQDVDARLKMSSLYLEAEYSTMIESIERSVEKTKNVLKTLEDQDFSFLTEDLTKTIKQKLILQLNELNGAREKIKTKLSAATSEIETAFGEYKKIQDFRQLLIANRLVQDNDAVLLKIKEQEQKLESITTTPLRELPILQEEVNAIVRSMPEIKEVLHV